MKKIVIFAILLAIALIGFAISLYALTVTYQSQSSNELMSNMMGQMMGGQGGIDTQQSTNVPSYLWILPAAFVGLLILGVAGLLYFLAVPEIKVSPQPLSEPATHPSEPQADIRGKTKVSTLLNTMKPEEQKVIEVLTSHGGKYLQKNIAKESDLSRLKTHRIISRFAERDIVTVRPFGNTNEVTLSSWLISDD